MLNLALKMIRKACLEVDKWDNSDHILDVDGSSEKLGLWAWSLGPLGKWSILHWRMWAWTVVCLASHLTLRDSISYLVTLAFFSSPFTNGGMISVPTPSVSPCSSILARPSTLQSIQIFSGDGTQICKGNLLSICHDLCAHACQSLLLSTGEIPLVRIFSES